ncbi:MAG: RNA methyltransferase, TrmA family [Candidatus Carbobacillus altaicus]|uniref:RNA methyltransferase, TrmA family n=1 Tax=Candidatus Carbonibacillus altaicus TaxID=2163959 RepID=A0A2R6Y4R7_9BACL|nr:MAG: RNA methyltransferase, TrmA family [Candidatus Carbobacillus altaicus]
MQFYIEVLDEKGYGLARPHEGAGTAGESLSELSKAQVPFHSVQTRGGGKRVRIPFTLPGEVVYAEPTLRREKGIRIYRATDVVTAHVSRVPARCPHFGRCGGCQLQHMSYAEEMRYKTALVRQATIQAGFSEKLVQDVLGMPEPWTYRNKMEFTFAPDGALGLHRLGDFRSVEPLTTCAIAQPEMVRAMQIVAEWAQDFSLPGYDKKTHTGVLRHVMVRKSARGELLLALFATHAPQSDTGQLRPEAQALLERLEAQGGVRTLIWYVYRGLADRVGFDERYVLKGDAFIEDELLGFTYRLQPETFFQTNALQAERLLREALRLADVRPFMRVIDLFSGVGTFTLPLARQAEMAYGIEIVPHSVEEARHNAERNGVTNALFFAGDVRRSFDAVLEVSGRTPDVIVLDPPRSGAGGKVMRRIGRTGVPRVVYVSCQPKTWAEDLKELKAFGYVLKHVQPVDMFPKTPHVELVSLLEKEA